MLQVFPAILHCEAALNKTLDLTEFGHNFTKKNVITSIIGLLGSATDQRRFFDLGPQFKVYVLGSNSGQLQKRVNYQQDLP